jgi:hypothetical protein
MYLALFRFVQRLISNDRIKQGTQLPPGLPLKPGDTSLLLMASGRARNDNGPIGVIRLGHCFLPGLIGLDRLGEIDQAFRRQHAFGDSCDAEEFSARHGVDAHASVVERR